MRFELRNYVHKIKNFYRQIFSHFTVCSPFERMWNSPIVHQSFIFFTILSLMNPLSATIHNLLDYLSVSFKIYRTYGALSTINNEILPPKTKQIFCSTVLKDHCGLSLHLLCKEYLAAHSLHISNTVTITSIKAKKLKAHYSGLMIFVAVVNFWLE